MHLISDGYSGEVCEERLWRGGPHFDSPYTGEGNKEEGIQPFGKTDMIWCQTTVNIL